MESDAEELGRMEFPKLAWLQRSDGPVVNAKVFECLPLKGLVLQSGCA